MLTLQWPTLNNSLIIWNNIILEKSQLLTPVDTDAHIYTDILFDLTYTPYTIYKSQIHWIWICFTYFPYQLPFYTHYSDIQGECMWKSNYTSHSILFLTWLSTWDYSLFYIQLHILVLFYNAPYTFVDKT